MASGAILDTCIICSGLIHEDCDWEVATDGLVHKQCLNGDFVKVYRVYETDTIREVKDLKKTIKTLETMLISCKKNLEKIENRINRKDTQ